MRFSELRTCGSRGHAPLVERLEVRTLLSTIAYWRFEEGTANVAATVANSIIDSSGNSHAGTPINGPVYSSSVPISKIPQTGAANLESIGFDGTSQRIFVPDSTQFQLTKSLTLEAWVNIGAPGNNPFGERQIVFRGDDQFGLDPYQLRVAGNQIAFDITGSDNTRQEVNTPLPPLHQWVHVAGVLDDATGRMSLYLDGQLKASMTTTSRPLGPLTGANPGIGIGDVESNTYEEHFNGLIDEVRISDVALQPSQFLDANNTPSSISGQVFKDVNVNGVRNSGEPGMPGVTVYLDLNKDGKLESGEPTQVTNSFGSYKFSGLLAGAYRVREIPPAQYVQTAPAAKFYDLTLKPGANVTGKLFGNAHAAASISGRVFGDSNGNGVRDPGEVGMGLWKVFVDLNKDGVLDGNDLSTTTDFFGKWSFGGLTKGTYLIRVVPVDGLAATTATVLTVTVGDGQVSTGSLFGERATT